MVKGKTIAQIRVDKNIVITAKKIIIKKPKKVALEFLQQASPSAKQKEIIDSQSLKLIKSVFVNGVNQNV